MIGDLVKRVGETGLGRKNPGAGWVFDTTGSEGVFGNFNIEVGKTIACGEEAFLAGILQEEYRAGAGEFSVRLRSFGEGRE